MEFIVIWVFCGFVAAAIAGHKGRSVVGWLLLGFLFGPLALTVALLPSADTVAQHEAQRVGYAEGYKKCPACAEAIRIEAVKCRYCQTDVASFVPKPLPTKGLQAIPPPPGVEVFIDNDMAYKAWLTDHPDGLVLNCYRDNPAGYMAIHHASCLVMTQGFTRNPGPQELTGKEFIKACSNSDADLNIWASQQGFLQAFKTCARCESKVRALVG